MEHDRMRRPLEYLGIPLEDYRVLKLLPLVYVAWADGKMGLVQKDRIHSFAARHYDLSAAGMGVLAHWLDIRPTQRYIAEGLRDIYKLAIAQDDMEFDLSELPGLLAYAEAIARSTALALDQPRSVTAVEENALVEIARELHIDHGESWAKLLDELGPPALSAPTPRRAMSP